jgi:hypothetical protein
MVLVDFIALIALPLGNSKDAAWIILVAIACQARASSFLPPWWGPPDR